MMAASCPPPDPPGDRPPPYHAYYRSESGDGTLDERTPAETRSRNWKIFAACLAIIVSVVLASLMFLICVVICQSSDRCSSFIENTPSKLPEMLTTPLSVTVSKHVLKRHWVRAYYDDYDYYSGGEHTSHGLPTVTDWKTQIKPGYIGAGIRYNATSGCFIVTTSGVYEYSDHLELSARVITDETFIFHHQLLHVTSSGQRDVIFQNPPKEVTCHAPDPESGGLVHTCDSSTLHGLYELQAGDCLALQVEPLKYLLGDMESTYLSIMLIPSS